MDREYLISDLANEFNVTARALRFYESEGLLCPRRQGQRRIYSRRDYVRLKLLLRGKRLGFSLSESREIIDLYDQIPDERVQLERLQATLDKHRQQLLRKRNDLDAMLAELDRMSVELQKESV